MQTRQYDQMQVQIFDTNQALGLAAAEDLAQILKDAVAARGQAAVILATGNSQLTFLEGLRIRQDIPWNKVAIFHMDEYLGMSAQHPASFRRFLQEKLTRQVTPFAFYGINGDAPDIEAEMARYADRLAEADPVATVLGIGENGHLAFNDPPADFDADRTLDIVTLAEEARRQQVGEGHFPSLADVPAQAISLTIPALLRPAHVLAVVPEKRKAAAVKAALEGPVTPDCPASILRTQSKVRLYLDQDSASLLEKT